MDHSIDADHSVATLDRLMLTRGAPAFVRFDNGPEFIANAVAHWCRFNGVGSIFIDPGSPWQNAWIESFNRRLRDEFLNGWQFDSLLEAASEELVALGELPDDLVGRMTMGRSCERSSGPPDPNQHSDSDWTTQRGPLSSLVPDVGRTGDAQYHPIRVEATQLAHEGDERGAALSEHFLRF